MRSIAGEIRGMYILGENPAMSDPDVEHAREALAKLEHLVVQDVFLTETANFADVILPASAWPEKTGTVTNTNRQVQMGRKAVEPPGEAREDWRITVELGRRLGLDWDYGHPREVFAEMKLSMPSLDHITWERLEAENAVAYPSLSDDDPGQAVVFGDGFPRPAAARASPPRRSRRRRRCRTATYPFILITGRQLEHWHTGSMTRRASVLDALEPEATCSLHPATLRRLGVAPGRPVRLTTRRGERGAQGAGGPGGGGGHGLHPLRLCGGGGEHPDQPGARSVRQDPRVQVRRGAGRGGIGSYAGGSARAPRAAAIPWNGKKNRAAGCEGGLDSGWNVEACHCLYGLCDARRCGLGRPPQAAVTDQAVS